MTLIVMMLMMIMAFFLHFFYLIQSGQIESIILFWSGLKWWNGQGEEYRVGSIDKCEHNGLFFENHNTFIEVLYMMKYNQTNS